MKRKQLLFLPLLFLFVVSSAQKKSADTVYNHKHDIGFNTIFVFNGILNPSRTPFSVMYKRYTKNNQAFRMGMTSGLNLFKYDPSSTFDSTNTTYSTNSYYNLSLTFGKEFQRVIGTKWVWYYGVDVVPYYSYNEFTQLINGTANENYTSTRRTYSMSGRPFLGIRFNINSRLYLSAEANLSITYSKNSAITKNYVNTVGANSNVKSSSFSIDLTPASGMYLYYRF